MTETLEIHARFRSLPPGAGSTLPKPLLTRMEEFFDFDFSQVRICSSDAATRLGALAFTMGNDIVFAPGCYRPDTIEGLHLIGHELAHVVQQRDRDAWAEPQGVRLVADPLLEREADLLGIGAAAHSLGDHDQICDRLGQYRAGEPPVVDYLALSSDPSGDRDGRIIQRQTQLEYATKILIAPTNKIIGGTHSREMHNETQKKLVAYLSGYNSPSDAIKDGCMKVCNHYVPYQHVREAVLAALKSKTDVAAAAKWLNGIDIPGETYNGTLWGQPKNAWKFNVGELPPVVLYTVSKGCYDQKEVNREVDDLIYNLANDPRNMFYAATSTGDFGGTAIDKPLTLGPNAEVSVTNLVKRLEAYRALMVAEGVKV